MTGRPRLIRKENRRLVLRCTSRGPEARRHPHAARPGGVGGREQGAAGDGRWEAQGRFTWASGGKGERPEPAGCLGRWQASR